MRGFLFVSLLLLLSAAAHAVPFTMREIAPKDEEYLKKSLPRLFSEPDVALFDEAIRVLMTRGSYENIFVEKRPNGSFEIIGKPLRTVEEIHFSGNSEISESSLRELIDFKIGDRFDRKRAVAAGEKMKNYYGEHGFFNTVIELNFQKAESKNIRLMFNIDEKAPCKVKGLEFVTANTDLRTLLNSHFKWLRNKPLTTERIHELTQDLDSLLIDRRYMASEVVGPDARYNPEKTAAYLQIDVREPYKYEFYFSGNLLFTTADVYHGLDLKNRERKNVDPSSEGSERLRRAYLDKGFPHVQIDTKVVNPKGTYLKRVYYSIHEGPRVRIRAIEVQGRASRSPRYYQDIVLNHSSDLVSEGFYNRQALENGFKNLVIELRNQGFLRARVLSSRIEYSDKKDFVTVFLMLEEGPQTQIRGLDFVGNKFFSSFELAHVTELETNSPLRLDKFEQSLEKLKTFYRRQGFLEMKLLNESEDLIQYNEKGSQARVVFQIYEGPRIRVHSLSVEGNQKTKTSVILKEADFTLGEVLTPDKIDDATARLNKLGLFSRADVHTLEEGTNLSERTLVISVTENDPGIFSFGGGMTNERNLTLRGFTGASYNNLWGTARAISLRGEIRSNVAEVKYPETEITAGYFEPFLFNTLTRGRVNLTRSEYVYQYQKEPFNFTEITVKNRVDFLTERDLSRHYKLTYKVLSLESRTDFERYGRTLPKPDDPNAKFDPTLGKGPSNTMQVATIGPQLDIDYRDNPFLPTRGTFTRMTVDYSNPNFGSSKGVEFIKGDGSFTVHTPVAPKWVWANSIHGGYLKNLSRQTDSGVPSDYAFLLGGIYSLRGFDLSNPQERVPKDGNKGFRLGETNSKLIKGTSDYYLLKTEMRFPLYGDFGGVLFYDGGAVHINGREGYDFKRPYRDSVGFGFRYNTQVGPVALDFGFKIRPEPNEAPYRFHFSIGTF